MGLARPWLEMGLLMHRGGVWGAGVYWWVWEELRLLCGADEQYACVRGCHGATVPAVPAVPAVARVAGWLGGWVVEGINHNSTRLLLRLPTPTSHFVGHLVAPCLRWMWQAQREAAAAARVRSALEAKAAVASTLGTDRVDSARARREVAANQLAQATYVF